VSASRETRNNAVFSSHSDELRNAGESHGRTAGDNDRLGAYAAELVGIAPDVLLAVTVTSLVALHRQTNSLPIVFAQVGDAVKLRVVAGLALLQKNFRQPLKSVGYARRSIALCGYRTSPSLRLAFSTGGIGKFLHSRHWRVSSPRTV
jgi:hypothetical protein